MSAVSGSLVKSIGDLYPHSAAGGTLLTAQRDTLPTQMELSVLASPSQSSSSSAAATSGTPRTPMSERQQLAMIKQLEKEGAAASAAGNPDSGGTGE